MNRLFASLLERHTPKMNDSMINGMAVERVSRVEAYIDSVFRSAFKSNPAGLEYIDYKRCSPAEEYAEATKPRNNRRTADIARSDIYLCKYLFRFQGEDLDPKYIYLPFLREGGFIHLGGSLHHISPVLSDRVISISYDGIFVRLLRNKLTFKRLYHGFKINNKREVAHVIWSEIYRKGKTNSSVPATTKAETTIMHYLFAKFGFREALYRLLGCHVVVGQSEINEESYPSSEWVICQSDGIKPRSYIGLSYMPSDIRIAVPVQYWNTTAISIMASVYYLLDHFPAHMTISELESQKKWMVLLGHIVFSGNYTVGKLYDSISEHFNSLEEYVDEIISKKLIESGYPVHDFYDLLILIAQNSNDWIVSNQNNITSIYGKNLEIDYYVVYSIIVGIFLFVFNLNKQAARKTLTKKDITDLMNKTIKPGSIYKLTSGNLAVSSANYSGDNKYPKITSPIAEQESLPGPKRGKHKRRVPNITKRFHTSMLELGSLLYLPKSNPICIARLNPYTKLTPDNNVIAPRLYPEILEKTQKMLEGVFEGVLPK